MVKTEFNPKAERRRLRLLEKQRIEEQGRLEMEMRVKIKNEIRERELKEREELALKQAEEQRQRDLAAEIERNRIETAENGVKLRDKHIESEFRVMGVFCAETIRYIQRPVAVCVLPSLLGVRPVCRDANAQDRKNLLRQELLFISDENNSIHLIDQIHRHIFSFGQTGHKAGQFSGINSMDASKWNQLIVCDRDNCRIQIIDVSKLIKTSSSVPCDSMTKRYHIPHHIVEGCIVSVLGQKGGGIEEFKSPRGIQIDATNGDIYVSDQLNHRIQVLKGYSDVNRFPDEKNPFPIHLRSFGERGSGDGQLFRPFGIALSHYHVIICDNGNHRISIYTKRGVFVASYGAKGSAEGEFRDPRQVYLLNVKKAVIPNGEFVKKEQFYIVIADTNNFRVQMLTENGVFLRMFSYIPNQRRLDKFYLSFQEHSAMQLEARSFMVPSVQFLPLHNTLNPRDPQYEKIMMIDNSMRQLFRNIHHPIDICGNSFNQIVTADRTNDSVYFYSSSGAAFQWFSPEEDIQPDGGIATNATDSILVIADTLNNRLVLYSTERQQCSFHSFIGATTYGNVVNRSAGSKPGELHHPTGIFITIETDGVECIVVSDNGNNRIQVFELLTGKVRRAFSSVGHTEGFLQGPQGISVMDGEVYVCDQMNDRIQVFDFETGLFHRTFGSRGSQPGRLKLPSGLATCTSLTQAPLGCDFGPNREAKVVIADTGNHRIQVFSPQGVPILCVGSTSPATSTALDSPTGIDIHPETGHIIICSAGNRKIHIVNRSGQTIHEFGHQFKENDQFKRPIAVKLSNTTSVQLWVVDSIRCEYLFCTTFVSN